MKFIPMDIPDLVLIEPRIFRDPRGFFYESYNHPLFAKNGIPGTFIQDNQSSSALGVLRGLHYQIPPKAQAKLVRVVRGSIFDVAVDIRKASPTLGKHVAVILSAEEPKTLYVPEGFAHGFVALEDRTEVIYKVSNPYSPEHERGIIWDDPVLGIPWPRLSCGYTLSEKDRRYPPLKDACLF